MNLNKIIKIVIIMVILIIAGSISYYYLFFLPSQQKEATEQQKEEQLQTEEEQLEENREKLAKEERKNYREHLVKWCKPDCFYFPEKEGWGYNPLFSMYVDLLEFHNIKPENADWFSPSQESCVEFCVENELRAQRKIDREKYCQNSCKYSTTSKAYCWSDEQSCVPAQKECIDFCIWWWETVLSE